MEYFTTKESFLISAEKEEKGEIPGKSSYDRREIE